MSKLIYILLCIGLVLLPFSTSPESKLHVISFGTPFFVAAGVFIIMYLCVSKPNFHALLRMPILITALYIASISISLFFSSQFMVQAWRVFHNILGFLMFLFILSFSQFNSPNIYVIFNRLSCAIVISGVVMASFFIINLMWVLYTNDISVVFTQRYGGGLMSLTWGASNSIAAALIMPLFIAVANHCVGDGRRRIWMLVSIVVMLAAIVLTFSRTVMLILTCVFLIYCFLSRNTLPIILSLTVFMALVGLCFIYDENAFYVLCQHRIGEHSNLSNMSGRLDVWYDWIQYFLNNPWPIGHYGCLYELENSPHNLFIAALVEQGITGPIILILFFGISFRWAIEGLIYGDRLVKQLFHAFLCGLLALFINLQVEDANYTAQYVSYFWVFFGLMYLARYARRQKGEGTNGLFVRHHYH